MKNILYFYPENPLISNQGNNARAFELLQYFSKNQISVDLVGVESNVYQNKDLAQLQEKKLINNGLLLKKKRSRGLRYLVIESIPNKFKLNYKKLYNRVKYGSTSIFNSFIKERNYDYIIISYAYWMPLVINNPNLKNAKIIVDTHDFLTAQFQNRKKFDIGFGFKTEIQILNLADIVWAISDEENYLFSQFIEKPVYTIRHGLKDNSKLKSTTNKYDIIYVASNNEHNLRAASWFFSQVYPLLPKYLNICVVGRVSQVVPEYPNITKMQFVEKLEDIYKESKICICPMLSGTGVKIKVIEALSFGIPVVCNTRGVDGLPNKLDNGCLVENDAPNFAQKIAQLSTDEELYNSKQKEATTFFNKSFNKEIIHKELNNLLQ